MLVANPQSAACEGLICYVLGHLDVIKYHSAIYLSNV
jgi:hypothetical protein